MNESLICLLVIIGIFLVLYFSVKLLTRVERYHCGYCGNDLVIENNGKFKHVYKETDGKISYGSKEDEICFYSHRGLLDIQSKLRKQKK